MKFECNKEDRLVMKFYHYLKFELKKFDKILWKVTIYWSSKIMEFDDEMSWRLPSGPMSKKMGTYLQRHIHVYH